MKPKPSPLKVSAIPSILSREFNPVGKMVGERGHQAWATEGYKRWNGRANTTIPPTPFGRRTGAGGGPTLLDQGEPLSVADDRAVREAAAFLQAWRGCKDDADRQRLALDRPALFGAHQLSRAVDA